MKIYTISGFAPWCENGYTYIVNDVYSNLEQATAAFNIYVNQIRLFAKEAEEIQSDFAGNGFWKDSIESLYGTKNYQVNYVCDIYVDIETEDGLAMFKKKSVVGLLNDGTSVDLLDGINLDSKYSKLSFRMASIELKCKEIN